MHKQTGSYTYLAWSVLLLVLLVCSSCAQETQYDSKSLTTADNLYRQTQYARMIKAEAILLQQSLYGEKANTYYLIDSSLNYAIRYWATLCGLQDANADQQEVEKVVSICPGVKPGVINCDSVNGKQACNIAVAGDLQAVEFVLGVFASLGGNFALPLKGSGSSFFPNYKQQNGWFTLSSETLQKAHGKYSFENLPWSGDIVGFKDDNAPSAGHLAIVVQCQLPAQDTDGYIIVAGANQSGNVNKDDLYSLGASNGNFEKIIWHSPDYMDEHKDAELFAFDNWQKDPQKPNLHLQGFIRRLSYDL